MPRRPKRQHHSLRHRPVTFSPFARSMALATSSQRARREIQGAKLHTKDFPTTSVNENGFINHSKDKAEQSDSSDDEEFEDSKCILELKDYLLKVCQDMDVTAKLSSLVGEQAQDVGLMVSQRVVNLPPQLLPPLYDALFDEVQWATEDEPTEEVRNSFRFKFYLIISKIYKHKNVEQNRVKIKSGEEPVIYMKPEDEIFFELSSWSFSFPLHAQKVTTNELKNYRLMGLVMAVEASKVSRFRKQLHSLIDE